MAIDVSKLVGLFEMAVKIFECLKQMQPQQRSRLLAVVEKLSGMEGIAADLESLVDE